MQKICLTVLLWMRLLIPSLNAQETYFPPALGNTWETVSPDDLSWCMAGLDSLDLFLESKNTKAFIILKNGRIAYERYYGTFTMDSAWYWASAGKSLAATLVGIAQEEGLLNIEDPTAQYLGAGWTATTPDQEAAIRIRHQLEMTTGFRTQGVNLDCLADSCLEYLIDPGQRWFYHNAPYRLLQDVIASAANTTINAFTFSRLSLPTGIYGTWLNYVFFSRPRNMARFGLLIEQEGIWNGQTILGDTAYLQAMVSPSQPMNPAYGYLWWLNGQASHRLPGLDLSFPGKLVPNAPDGMFAGMGKNEQRVYIVPDEDLVIVRMGDAAGSPVFAVSEFDNDLWGKLQDVFCASSTSLSARDFPALRVYADSERRQLRLWGADGPVELQVFDQQGRLMWQQGNVGTDISLPSGIATGLYLLRIKAHDGRTGQLRFRL